MPVKTYHGAFRNTEVIDNDAGYVTGTAWQSTLVGGAVDTAGNGIPMAISFVAPPSGIVRVVFGAWMGSDAATTVAGSSYMQTRITGGHHTGAGADGLGTVYGDHTALYMAIPMLGYPAGTTPAAGAALPAALPLRSTLVPGEKSYNQANLETGVKYTITAIHKTTTTNTGFHGYFDSRYLRILPIV